MKKCIQIFKKLVCAIDEKLILENSNVASQLVEVVMWKICSIAVIVTVQRVLLLEIYSVHQVDLRGNCVSRCQGQDYESTLTAAAIYRTFAGQRPCDVDWAVQNFENLGVESNYSYDFIQFDPSFCICRKNARHVIDFSKFHCSTGQRCYHNAITRILLINFFWFD